MNTTTNVPAIGQYWEGQGGVLFDLEPGRNGGPAHWLIAASDKDGNLTVLLKASYGNRGTMIGADSYLDGDENTRKLLAASSPLAVACTGVESDGHKDFFAPAQCQVNVLRAHLFEKVKDAGWVLTSTEYSPYFAWIQHFGVGTQNLNGKDREYPVFPVRRVPAE